MGTNYVQGSGLGTGALKLPLLKCSGLTGESNGKRINHTPHVTLQICIKYPSLTEEGTTFSSWIKPRNLTEKKVKVKVGKR